MSARLLQVFLCHSSEDKTAVRKLYRQLRGDGVAPWLDEENLLPGQHWQQEIPKAVRAADVVVVCLSKRSITKEGYIQKEIRYALDAAEEKPEDTIFLIPLKIEECEVPERFRRWQWVNLFDGLGYDRLMRALQVRAGTIQGVGPPTRITSAIRSRGLARMRQRPAHGNRTQAPSHVDRMAELDLMVGSMFTSRPEEDRELFEEEREWLSDIQDLLREEGVKADLLSRPSVEIWEGGIDRFMDLYQLRQIAVYLEQDRDIAPLLKAGPPSDGDPDPLLVAIWDGEQPTRFPHLNQSPGRWRLLSAYRFR
jgi:TIR domain-containing protein